MKQSYYDRIDELRDKFDKNECVTLSEACWILWAECLVCSDQYSKFKDEMVKQGFARRKLTFPMWKGAFDNWVKESSNVSLT